MSSSKIPCPVCNKNTIDIHRNKRKKCKQCADKEQIAEKRQKHKEIQLFSFESGCKKALHKEDETPLHSTLMLQCQPFKIKIRKNQNKSKEMDLYGIIHRDEANSITKELDFDAITRSTNITADIQLSEPHIEKTTCQTCESNGKVIGMEAIESQISESVIPNMLKSLGPYEEMDEIISKLVNTDFRVKPEKLYFVADLFTGAIIYDKLCLVLISCEVYSRHTSIDIHAESEIDSVPSSKCFYKGLSCSIFISSDGKKSMKKLIIGSHTWNLLITCSATISSNKPTVFIGPQVDEDPSSFSSTRTRIFLQSSKIESFKKAMELDKIEDIPKHNISSLRQLVSSFEHHSTYAPLKATLNDFDDIRLMPVTVFTLCDLPDQDGYGSNYTAASRLGSLLLQKFAIAFNENRDLMQEEMSPFMSIYKTCNIVEDKDCWKPIVEVVTDMEKHFASSKTIDTLLFIKNHNFSKIAGDVGNSLHKANTKIANNIQLRLLRLYG